LYSRCSQFIGCGWLLVESFKSRAGGVETNDILMDSTLYTVDSFTEHPTVFCSAWHMYGAFPILP